MGDGEIINGRLTWSTRRGTRRAVLSQGWADVVQQLHLDEGDQVTFKVSKDDDSTIFITAE